MDIKYKRILLLGAVLVIIYSATAFTAAASPHAAASDILSYIQIGEEEMSELKSETSNILSLANDFSIDMSRTVTEKDIDWSKLTKMYLPTEELQNSDTINVEDFLQNTEYIWTLQIEVDSKTIQIVFNKGKPVDDDVREFLTDRQIENLESYVGKWRASGAIFHESVVDYEKDVQHVFLATNLPEEYYYFIVTALPGIHTPMAIVMKGNTLQYAFPALRIANEQFAEEAMIPKGQLSTEGLYDYLDIIGYSNSYLINSKNGV